MTQAIHVSSQRCFHHFQREAVARCPECARFFCRECVTEHDDRLICASCLAKITVASNIKESRFRPIFRIVQCAAGFLIIWLFFYYAGQLLLKIPVSVHEGTLWDAD
jgi:hypothetical protein